jgi:aryl-alcohol dehydrogenase-like predicted oxidoreductase
MTRERIARLPHNDWRHNDARFQDPQLSHALRVVDQLKSIGERHGRTPGEIAIAWVLAHPAVTGAIVGGRSARQVEETTRASEFRLSDAEMSEIARAL